MSDYLKGHYEYSNNDGKGCGSLIFAIIIIIAFAIGVNSCSASTWNGGYCPSCETRYELCGVSKGLRYYSCPDCGQEVRRY